MVNRLASTLGYVPVVPKDRKVFGGRIAPPPFSETRWILADVEKAIHDADSGNLNLAAQLCDAIKRDGIAAGVLSTRTNGLIRLPKKYKGSKKLVDVLQGVDEKKGIFDSLYPPAELSKLSADGILLGVGVGQLLEVEGANPLVNRQLRRLDPRYLQFRYSENCYYYNSMYGPMKINPGDGTWILYTPGGFDEPWRGALWEAISRVYIAKEHAFYNRQNYGAKLANAARVAYSPQGSTQRQRFQFFQQLMAWGTNTVFNMPEGYDVKLLESNGRGHEVFDAQIKNSNEEMIIALAGQLVTTLGTGGFSSGNIHQAIRLDLIQAQAESLAQTINEQGLSNWVEFLQNYIPELSQETQKESPEVMWDTTPPEDLKAKAETIKSIGDGLKSINDSLTVYKKRLSDDDLSKQFDLKLEDLPTLDNPNPKP